MSQALTARQRRNAMAVVLVGMALTVLDGSILNLALPDISRQLHAHAADAIWVVNAYQLTSLVLLLPLASWGDRIGYRKVYLGGMALFLLASLMATLANGLAALVVARVLQGAGAAGVMSVNAALVRLIYPPHRLGRGIAINSLTVAVASVAGPSLAALVLSLASWPWLFAINLPLALLVLTAGYASLPSTPKVDHVHPVTGARPTTFAWPDVLLNGLMFALVFVGADGLGNARRNGVLAGPPAVPAWSWMALAAGFLIGAVYLQRQRRQDLPLLAVDLLRIPVFALSMCTSVTAFCAHTMAFVALPFLLLESQGLSPGHAGWLITMWPLATVLTAPLAGRLIGRVPDGHLGALGLGLLGLGLWCLASLSATEVSDWGVASRLLLCGVGFGLFQSPNNHTIITTPPPQRSGAAGGMQATARLTGQSLGAVVLALLFTFFSTLSPGSGQASSAAPQLALAVGGTLALLGAVFSSLRTRYAPGIRH